ncbi:uncharacterized protein LOC115310148 isoform X4 [Ixodes scapularis]|uniref:uncharacterized protein LOC115310148 isoform X4 n=1 Tax=Ixodes scapularis TaxID=6945 RepID=UPI001A9EB316|nr:uncharacterized protein LOC115310148 isoform X4 [Ixodes scapularis]
MMSGRKRQSRDSTCFVPGCRSGYRSCKEKFSLFRTPQDSARLQEWACKIKRDDRTLGEASVVCERHFEPQFIERTFKNVVQGQVIELPRSVPQLTKDAVPSVFPDAPKYFSKPVPKKRKERNLCDQVPLPLVKRHCVDVETQPDADLPISDASRDTALIRECLDLLPAPPWTKINLDGNTDQITFAHCHLSEEGALGVLHVSRRIVLDFSAPQGSTPKATVYLRGKEIKNQSISSANDVKVLLHEIGSMKLCPGYGLKPMTKTFVCFNGCYFSAKCSLISESPCLACKYMRKLSQNAASRKKRIIKAKKSASKSRALRVLKRKLAKAQSAVESMKNENEQLSKTDFQQRMSALPSKQQLAVTACFEAARRKSAKGMQYTNEWLLECILMRMKSPRLYEHNRRHKILALPGRTCLQKRILGFKGGFGFNQKIFEALSEKTKCMDKFACHGGIVFDEMKISEHLDVKSTGDLEGFVDLAQFTPESQKGQVCDHGMVVLFQPFQGQWTQVLGVFASRGNVKADTLAKIIVEATILCEKAGLFVDFVTCDGASWNRSMWRIFGIRGTAKGTRCKTPHPVRQAHHLHFLSDFPHLLKNVRNAFIAKGFNTPEGRAHIRPIQEAWKIDSKTVSLKVMPSITRVHVSPNSFEKMRVAPAFQLFGDEVVKGLFLYRAKLEAACGSIEPTESFVKRINKVIRVMSSRFPKAALYAGSPNYQFLKKFLEYLRKWESHAKSTVGGFLSSSTAEGLHVTIESTLHLLDYINTIGFKYIMTANLSQDRLENLFGVVRQSSGANDHPTAAQFLITVNALAFYNLARPPKSGNCSPELINSLISNVGSELHKERAIDILDGLIDKGKLNDAEEALSSCTPSDHSAYVTEKSNDLLIYYIAGYVVRKTVNKTSCEVCVSFLQTDQYTAMEEDQASSFTAHFDNGGLMYPSGPLRNLITLLEDSFTTYFSLHKLHSRSIKDFFSFLVKVEFPTLGCLAHEHTITTGVIKYYVLLRFRFYTKALNNDRMAKQERMKLLKERRLK